MSTMTKRLLKTVGDLIDALGGPTVVGDRYNIGQSAVSMWKVRGEIPAGWHLRMYLGAKEMGYEVDPGVFGLDSFEGLAPIQPVPKRRRSAGARARVLA